jgi:putative nucleotidyltransferase with HDIG domain
VRRVEPDGSDEQNRWNARPVLAALLKIVVVAVPVLCSLAAAWIASGLLPHPTSSARWFYRALTVVIGLAVAVLAERGARRLLPMTTLLKLSLLFPDQAPSRFKVARQANATQRLGQMAKERDGSAVNLAADILALLAALTSHDKRTRGHAERVRVYADLLAEQLRLSRDEQDRLRWAALLHDIGKLSVDPEILNKPGKPSEREWAILKAHPEEGAKAAAALLTWLGEWGRAIIEHHEKFDGTGYPNGLAGTKISQAGRLIGVVDAFEVMTAARSYKRPMSTLKAREELTRCSGTHFDPLMVRAFLAISLPRLLWATGPLSFFVQLPVIGAARDVGTQVLAAGTPVVAAAAASAVVVATGSGATVVAAPSSHQRSIAGTLGVPVPARSDAEQLAPAAKNSAVPSKRNAPASVVTSSLPLAVPSAVQSSGPAVTQSPDQAPAPVSTPVPEPTPVPDPTPSPTPIPDPTPAPPAAVPPSLVMTSGPAASTTSNTATVTFTVDDPSATVTCSLDGWPGSACSGSWSGSNIGVGPHVLMVVATNAGGTTTQTYSWTVTAPIPSAPTVTVTSGPATSSTATSATVGFTVDDPAATVNCSLDGGSASACSGSWSASGLAVGSHVLTIAATNAGGTGTQTYSWTVTAPIPSAPTVTVTSGPAASTPATNATVAFSADDPSASVTCSLDGAAASPCSGSWSRSGLAVGSHVLTIAATNAGGTGTQTYSWTVTATLPAAPTVTVTSGPAASSTQTSANVAFTVDDSSATVTCSLDGGAASNCHGNWSGSNLSVGAHVLTIAATNAGGTGTQTYSWTVAAHAQAAPNITVTGGPASSTTSTAAMVSFTVDDSAATVTCSLDGGPAATCASAWTAAGLPVGSHTLTIFATNAGGTTTHSYSWTINAVTPPPVSIDTGPADGSSVPGPGVSFTFTSTAAGATFQCKLDGGVFTACNGGTQTYVVLAGSHTFQVRAVVGGVTGPVASRTFFVLL